MELRNKNEQLQTGLNGKQEYFDLEMRKASDSFKERIEKLEINQMEERKEHEEKTKNLEDRLNEAMVQFEFEGKTTAQLKKYIESMENEIDEISQKISDEEKPNKEILV